MDVKQEILGIPRALRETLEKGRAEYEALVRKTRWGEGPITIVGGGASRPSGLTGAYAFESLLGWPVVARSPEVFRAYALSTLRPRSVILAIPSPGHSDEMLEVTRAARSRGAVLLALSEEHNGPLVEMADGVFLLRTGSESRLGLRAIVCQQAAICAIALAAAQIFKPRNSQTDIILEEIDHLAEHVEWAYTQLTDAIASLASELVTRPSIRVVGGGFYHPTALQAACSLRRIAALDAEGCEASVFDREPLEIFRRGAGVIFLSGTRCRLKSAIHEAAKEVKRTGAKIFAVTDSNDVELAERSSVAVLLPLLSEMVGSSLTLALLLGVAQRAACEQERVRDRPASPGRDRSKAVRGRDDSKT